MAPLGQLVPDHVERRWLPEDEPARRARVRRIEAQAREAIQEALERTGWHQGRASEVLGVSARTLHRKIRSYGLQRPRP